MALAQKRVKKFAPAKKTNKIDLKQDIKPKVEMEMELLLEKFIRHCGNRGLTQNTQKTYKEFAIRFIKYLKNKLNINDITKVDSDIVEIYIDYLTNEREISKVTVNSTIRNLKPFFVWLTERGYIENNPFKGIKLIKADKKRKKPLTPEQIQGLLNAVDTTGYAGIRDYLIIKLLYGTGMRIDEVLSLRIKDVDLTEGLFYIEHQKNREDAFVPIPQALIKPLKKYLKTWLANDHKDNYFFQNQYGQKLQRHTFYKNLKDYARKARIDPKLVSPHVFRHTFAIEYLMAGGSTASLRRQLRQKDLKVVEEYLNWLPENVKKEHQQYNPLDRMEGTN